jgi:drug/metabolite transporter (DMT)-like permease
MMWAVFLFSVMNLAVKALEHKPAMEIVFFRCFISLTMIFVWLRSRGINCFGNPENRGRLWSRGLIGNISLYLFFVTLQNIPLATAVTIQYMAPVFTAILALFILKEEIRPMQWLFFALSFAGIVVLKGFDDRVSWLYLTTGIIAALFAGFAYVFVRSLSESEHPLVIVFYFQLVGTLLGGGFTIFNFSMPTGQDWLLLFAIGLSAHFAQVLLTKAISGEKVGIISSINFFGAIYASIFGWLLFNEKVTFGTFLGMLLVISGVIMNLIINAGRGQRMKRFLANLINR